MFSQKRYKTYRPDYSFCGLHHAQVVLPGDAGGQKLWRGDLR